MSEMTVAQVREARAGAEQQINEILLALWRQTGLYVYEVRVKVISGNRIGDSRDRPIAVEASIVLESP